MLTYCNTYTCRIYKYIYVYQWPVPAAILGQLPYTPYQLKFCHAMHLVPMPCRKEHCCYAWFTTHTVPRKYSPGYRIHTYVHEKEVEKHITVVCICLLKFRSTTYWVQMLIWRVQCGRYPPFTESFNCLGLVQTVWAPSCFCKAAHSTYTYVYSTVHYQFSLQQITISSYWLELIEK